MVCLPEAVRAYPADGLSGERGARASAMGVVFFCAKRLKNAESGTALQRPAPGAGSTPKRDTQLVTQRPVVAPGLTRDRSR